MPPPSDDYLTATDVAAELGVHLQTIQKHFRTGSLPGRKIGKHWQTTRAALDTWLAGGNQAPYTTTQNPPTLETKDHP